ncbi:MAG: DUF502 domain-containing protein [Deltaproteobacteria bacterium]|jgi:uncharacterized membrane protein|nr:DUF502 domain-containing protein [Deltaproteobacteria bacterium]
MQLVQGVKRVFKKYMLAGTVVLVPLIGTYLILKFIITSADNLFISMLPEKFQPQAVLGYDIPGLGLIATIVLIMIVGVVTRLYIGRFLVNVGDKIISKIPLGRGIYNAIKKFMSAILTNREEKFRSVVAVEYPRRDCWVIGFVTSDATAEFQAQTEKHLVNVFVPTTPNPTSGFLIMVPRDEIKKLSMDIDEAFKLLISGGIIQDEAKTELSPAQPS